MRTLARMGYTLVGLALIAPTAAQAGMPVDASTPWVQKPASRPGLFRSAKKNVIKLCAECNRVRVMAAEGVVISPPPPLPPGTVVRGEICSQCGRPAAVLAGRLPRNAGQGYGDHAAPGRAVVDDAPAFVSNGIDPAPIGAFPAQLVSGAGSSPTAPGGGGPGTRDGSVMPTSVASDPVAPGKHNRPHILSHLFGVSAIGRDHADEVERKKEEKHAMIPYGPQGQSTVTDVPASVVYGK